MIAVTDANSTTNLEKSLRNMLSLDIGMTNKFCTALGHGAPAVSNKGGLLELYTHEWERIFIDPLPSGKQRERMVTLFTNNLRDLDASAWYLSDEWLENVIARIATSHAPVWANANFVGVTSSEMEKGTDVDDDVARLKNLRRRRSRDIKKKRALRGKNSKERDGANDEEDEEDGDIDDDERGRHERGQTKYNSELYVPIIASSLVPSEGPSSPGGQKGSETTPPAARGGKGRKGQEHDDAETKTLSSFHPPTPPLQRGVLVDMSFLPNDTKPQVLLYPAAISYLLRLIRIIGTFHSLSIRWTISCPSSLGCLHMLLSLYLLIIII